MPSVCKYIAFYLLFVIFGCKFVEDLRIEGVYKRILKAI